MTPSVDRTAKRGPSGPLPTLRDEPPLTVPLILGELLGRGIISPDAWGNLPGPTRARLARCRSTEVLLALLVAHELLTEFQSAWVRQGRISDLRIGPYRVRDMVGTREGSGCFRAEHIYLSHSVHLRIVTSSDRRKLQSLCRYSAASRALPREHPNIVCLLDVGECTWSEHAGGVAMYLVSDFVEGNEFADYCASHAPLATDLACDWIYQIAAAIHALHAAGLPVELHPANVLITKERQVKLLELGVAADATSASASVINTLGGLLYGCITGQAPGCTTGRHPDISLEIQAIIRRARSPRVETRYESLCAFKHALAPLRAMNDSLTSDGPPEPRPRRRPVARLQSASSAPCPPRVLIVDVDPEIRGVCRLVLEPHGIECEDASCGTEAIRMSQTRRFDLVLLDMAMPGMSGAEVCRRLRAHPPTSNLKILMISEHMHPIELAPLLAVGADDYVTKPCNGIQLLGRIKAALRLKEAQDRADEFHHHLLGTNLRLEHNLHARDQDLVEAHQALVLAMAKLVECRDSETGAHVWRLQAYSRRLAEEAATSPAFAELIDANFVRSLEWGAPLHDIGKAGIPDAILRKPGPLDATERRIMQTHAALGADTLREVSRKHGSGMAFLHMAIEIAHHHHERFDGTGYPDGLAHHNIPLSARLVAVADVYDALRSNRVYKSAMPHDFAVQTILDKSPGQFDPALLKVFSRCAADFDTIFSEALDER